MPTCDSKAKPSSLGSLSAAELDHHASEAAKVKRTKEQAYFNSYDFDAIEVLPFEEGQDDRSQSLQHQHHHHHHGTYSGLHSKYTVGGCKKCHHMSPSLGGNATLPTVSHSHSLNSRPQHNHLQPSKKNQTPPSSHSSSTNSSLSSFSRPTTVAAPKRTYLKRIGAFFMTTNPMHKRSSVESLTDVEKQVAHASSSASSSSQISMDANVRAVGKMYNDGSSSSGVCGGNSNIRDNAIMDDAVNNNFLLPRAMLKYQSIGVGNSMPLSVISNLGGSSTSLQSSSICGQHNQVAKCAAISTSCKLQSNTVESSISPTDALAVIHGNLKKPPNVITTKSAAKENSGFISLSSSSSSSLLAKSSVATSSLSAESSIIGETSTNAADSGALALTSAPATVAGAPVASKSITNPNVVSSITNDLQPSYDEKLASSTASSSAAGVVGGAAGGGTPSSGSIITTTTTGGGGRDAAANRHGNSGRGARERTSSQSHYSTDKSGSSGYYSSNVCSTYSVEDHIYCEPVIDILDANKSASSLKPAKLVQQSGKSARKIMIVHNSDDDDEDHHNHRPHRVLGHQRQHQKMRQNLRILETSIENLDRHLKNYPKLSALDRLGSFDRSNPQAIPTNFFQVDNADGMKSRYGHLPTIMEGGATDGPASLQKSWQEEIAEDSLLDIDLDSFLLVSERKNKGSAVNGIDNPTFDKSEILHDEDMENNYKCAKYINSCPEDAYRLESEVGNTLDHFLKKYEDQIHFQNTRELLEDVRDKIRLLSESSEGIDSTTAVRNMMDKDLPQELETMIKALKSELESYLERMNQHSEMEIRQLCTGLVKNQNIVKMKNAFERRKSNGSETEYDFAYEAIRDGGTIVTVQHTRQHIEKTSIRCASDPNFKMKRKSLCEVFPAVDAKCSVGLSSETVVVASGGVNGAGTCCVDKTCSSVLNSSASVVGTRTQLQRNLSFHKPILNKLGGEPGGDGDRDSILDSHRKKPSIWEMYYGTNRMNQTLLGKRGSVMNTNQAILSYPSSRPESDFTLDLPRAEQLRIKMEKEKKFRRRCRYLTTFLSLVFFLLTVMVVSLVLTRGKRMFGSMI